MLRSIQRGFECITTISAGASFASADNGANFSRAIHHTQRVAAAFENVDVSFAVDRHGSRIDQRCINRIGAVPGDASLAVSGHSLNDSGREVHHPDPPVIQIGQVNLSPAEVRGDAVNPPKFCGNGRAAVAGKAVFAGSCDG